MRPLALVLLLSAATFSADPPREAVSANERGLAHLIAGRAGPAIEAFREARRLLPNDTTIARNLAAALAEGAERELQARRIEAAIGQLREARDLHPERIRYRVLLARAHLATAREGDRLNARDELVAALEADPDYLAALLLLAGIDYQERRLEEGASRLERARSLRPDDPTVRTRLAEMRRERDVELRYEAIESTVFIVRYAPSMPRTRAERVLGDCERAWSELTHRFGHYPESRIVVTLYRPADFRAATQLHGWVAGVSDGSIRLTVDTATRDAALDRTIRHELCHHIVRSLAPRTPVWLHEGLAQMAEGGDGERAAIRFREGSAPRVTDLDRSIIAERDPRRVADYYALALAFTHFLHQLQGDRGIQGILEGLKQGRTLDEACEAGFGKSRAELFDAWLRSIRPQ